MWRPAEASYDGLVSQLRHSQDMPTHLPWPLSPGWTVTDLASVGEAGDVRATMTGCSGATGLDGAIDLLVPVEAPGTGLGAARFGLPGVAPPASLWDEAPQARVRAGALDVRLWSVPVAEGRLSPPVPDTPDALFYPPDDPARRRSGALRCTRLDTATPRGVAATSY